MFTVSAENVLAVFILLQIARAVVRKHIAVYVEGYATDGNSEDQIDSYIGRLRSATE
jgi:hypothetical protein